jgi:hypothetical protein
LQHRFSKCPLAIVVPRSEKQAAMKQLRGALAVAALLALALAWRVVPEAYVAIAGVTVTGQVIARREFFDLPGEDRWRHVFEIEYRYRPLDEPRPVSASHQVDAAFYEHLQVGAPVQVRYSPWAPLRLVRAVGSVLVGSTWLSRIPFESDTVRGAFEMAGLAVAALLGYAAYRRRSRPLGWLAGLAGAIWISTIVLAGYLVFAVLFWAWRRNPGRGFGWLLLASMVFSTLTLYWRIPQPAASIVGPQRQATAIVGQTRLVTALWGGWRLSGQPIPRPFQMVDLQFVPQGAKNPVHVLDRVDTGTVSGLTAGAHVRIIYPETEPRAARIAGGTRRFARDALLHILEVTYGIGAALAFLLFPLLNAVGGRIRRSPILSRASDAGTDRRHPGVPPEDDPRRKALEAFLRARRNRSE